MAEVFANRGSSVLLVRGDDGMDEITTTADSTVWVVHEGTVREERIALTDHGIRYSTAADLQGGDAEVNAEAVRELLRGTKGAVRDAVVLNAAGAMVAFDGPGNDLQTELSAGIERAERAIDSGAAAELLARWAERSTALAIELG